MKKVLLIIAMLFTLVSPIMAKYLKTYDVITIDTNLNLE